MGGCGGHWSEIHEDHQTLHHRSRCSDQLSRNRSTVRTRLLTQNQILTQTRDVGVGVGRRRRWRWRWSGSLWRSAGESGQLGKQSDVQITACWLEFW
ncbi:hypothetical protein OJAV_G00202680 [Oryzias javanicus]|uniref:Uncharacterized protein n=1 Tax=Oryzias javanicus TaxID=123683 RepID=A0A437C585_ORYJA|nr:hypothetical protein OJAV_G00202680 [Oryzias javanicus]